MLLTILAGGCTAALLALLWWQASVAQRRLRQMTIHPARSTHPGQPAR